MNTKFINAILKKIINEDNELYIKKILKPEILLIFKHLDSEKKTRKNKSELLELIKSLCVYMGISSNLSLYILELYVLNYRENGDYKNITSDNFVDPKKMVGKGTSNSKANQYTIAMLPFKGSNLNGFWEKDVHGVEQYVVTSYKWYPIYIFKNEKWYEIVDSYSISTSRHISNSNPVSWSDKLSCNVFLLTSDEMSNLRSGVSHSKIMEDKLKKLKDFNSEIGKRKQNTKISVDDFGNHFNTKNYSVKYKVKSIDLESNKIATITVDVYDVIDRNPNAEPKNYLKDNIQNLTIKRVEDEIKMKVRSKLKKYVGVRYRPGLPDEDINHLENNTINFKFNHLKK